MNKRGRARDCAGFAIVKGILQKCSDCQVPLKIFGSELFLQRRRRHMKSLSSADLIPAAQVYPDITSPIVGTYHVKYAWPRWLDVFNMSR